MLPSTVLECPMDVNELFERAAEEAQKVREEIAASQKRLADLEHFMNTGKQLMRERVVASQSSAPVVKVVDLTAPAFTLTGVGKVETKKERLIRVCSEILADGQHRTSAELVYELHKRGVEVGGN